MDSILASRPAAPGLILGIPKIFSEKILDVVEIYRQRALLRQWTVQSLIVDRTHPVLVRAVLQKKERNACSSLELQRFKVMGNRTPGHKALGRPLTPPTTKSPTPQPTPARDACMRQVGSIPMPRWLGRTVSGARVRVSAVPRPGQRPRGQTAKD